MSITLQDLGDVLFLKSYNTRLVVVSTMASPAIGSPWADRLDTLATRNLLSFDGAATPCSNRVAFSPRPSWRHP